MGRTIGPKNKIARRFGVNLGLKTNATKVARRINQKPGAHGATRGGRVSVSSYGKQLIEKQKAKFMYGLRERQFRNYVKEATRLQGDSGVALQQLLEMRLDNVVYRMGFAQTRAQGRQFTTHGMFQLNGKKMDIPSHIVRPGDVVGLRENKAKKTVFQNISEVLSQRDAPSWLAVDAVKKEGKVLGKPIDADLDKVFDVKLIIEYYSTR